MANLEAVLDATTLTREEAERIVPVVSALIERYAPNAPNQIKLEAIIRAAGWLDVTPAHSFRSFDLGSIKTEFSPFASFSPKT